MISIASQQNRIKPKIISIARPGEEVKHIAPKPKPVFEFHGWVLAYKLKVTLGAIGLMILGVALSLGGLNWFLAGAGLVALITFIFTRPCP